MPSALKSKQASGRAQPTPKQPSPQHLVKQPPVHSHKNAEPRGPDLPADLADAVQAKRNALGKDVNINKYVAGGIAVFDLGTRMLKWHTHLDLSTDETNYRAHIYSAPTVADLDGDGALEIVVGTSMVRTLGRLPAWPPVCLFWVCLSVFPSLTPCALPPMIPGLAVQGRQTRNAPPSPWTVRR